jgi:simple sugar transport system ATP-binding protein
MLHQHFLLAESLTVAENISLGLRRAPFGWRYDRRSAEASVEQLADETGLRVDPRARVADLSVGLRQRVEILKALSRGARLLLLDEPTAVLAPPEVESLFITLRALQTSGRTIVIVTHKLDEVFSLASDVTVLRAGQTVFSGALNGITPSVLAEKMIGSAPQQESISVAPTTGETVLRLEHVRAGMSLSIDSLCVRAGEIVGIAGVEGNGQPELAAIVAGLQTADSGRATLDRQHLAVIPADRQREGLILDFTLAENLILREQPTQTRFGLSWLDSARIQSNAARVLPEFGVQPPNPDLPAGSLSGGNQQKVIAARELRRKPRLILACNPTRGLDVGAAAEIYRRLLDSARKENAGVLLISSDLDEVLRLSDRVAVLFRGTLREIGARGVDKDRVGRAMVGVDAA